MQREGCINRSDITKIFGVSLLTASHDLQAIMQEMPDLMTYDPKRKAYVIARK